MQQNGFDPAIGDLLDLWEDRTEDWTWHDVVSKTGGDETLAKSAWTHISKLQKLNVVMKRAYSANELINATEAEVSLDVSDSEFGSLVATSRLKKIQMLDTGGLSVIWIYRDDRFGREVAVKFLKQEGKLSDQSRMLLLQEAEITAKLDHPGVPPVLAYGETESQTPYFVMRYVRGQSFTISINELHREWEEKGEKRRDELIRILLQQLVTVCNIVSYAHSRGVIHRDLKPDNIRVDRFGEVVLLDWGVAVFWDRQSGSAPREVSMIEVSQDKGRLALNGGTPSYISPEVWENAPASPSNDVYALGVILYQILANKLPIQRTGNLSELASRVRAAEYEDIDDASGCLGRFLGQRDLGAIVRKAMAVDPSKRYVTADAMARDIESVLADTPTSVRQSNLYTKLLRKLRKNRTVGIALASLVVATLALSAALIVTLSSATGQATSDRDALLSTMAEFAADQVAGELAAKFMVLNELANNVDLPQLIQDAKSGNSEALSSMSALLETTSKIGGEEGRADSLWIQDSTGIQWARFPAASENIGQSFAYRQYFHGRSQDTDVGKPQTMQQEPNLSIIYQGSSGSNKYRIALTHPIRSGDDFVGCVGMSVELDRLASLRRGRHLSGLRIALADWRNYPIKGVSQTPRSGAVIHFVGDESQKKDDPSSNIRYVPAELLGATIENGVWSGDVPDLTKSVSELERKNRRTALAQVGWRPLDDNNENLKFTLPTLMIVVQQ
jgi:serine/threonine protein kinase